MKIVRRLILQAKIAKFDKASCAMTKDLALMNTSMGLDQNVHYPSKVNPLDNQL